MTKKMQNDPLISINFMKLCVYCVKIIAPSDVEPVLSIANHRYLLLNRIIGYFELNRTE